ncbi:MAG: PilZ domain-containing protein [Gemmataceae bacterium]
MESMTALGDQMIKLQERRQYPRLRREERAVLHRLEASDEDPEHAVLYCKTVDISAGGLQVRARQELQTGEPVEAVITLEGYGDSFRLRGEIRWCREAGNGEEFLVGVEFGQNQGGELPAWRRIFN